MDYEENGIKITGVIGNTMIAKENRKDQIFFLNGRYIKNSIITNSADQAFKGGTGINKYGFYILNIQMSPDMYDINVHPTKLEVRFKDENQIYKIVYHAVKQTILKNEFLGNKENENESRYVENEFEFLTSHFVNDKKDNNEKESKEDNNSVITRKEKRKIEYKYIGILFRTYIIIEIEDELYFIDQHAAHERILYEEIKENYKRHITNNTQMTLIPEIVNLSHKEIEFVKEYMDMFKNIGFDIELFGDLSVKINGIPDIDYKTNNSRIFLDVLDEMLTSERGGIRDIEERFIATVACKAAVKAHMDLSKDEVDYLIQNLLNLNNPYTCPHGRPTTIKYSKNELNKTIG